WDCCLVGCTDPQLIKHFPTRAPVFRSLCSKYVRFFNLYHSLHDFVGQNLRFIATSVQSFTWRATNGL
ncbi:MAG: hypothetical protein KGS48_01545, partial [Bacteroidetes bacterium]|nr:hypothetical protein [Bacteroidota bacterium]